ncbi:MAG: hypothetical protein IJ184_06175 [Alphaproteobacteria bacterium]|nr:hypothetical protein [Alphaproteobacteria bacterium]
MRKRNKLIKTLRRWWEAARSSKTVIILSGMAILALLMAIIMLQQRDIGAKEAGLQIEKLADNVRNYYKVRPDYWGLSTTEVVKHQLYPKDMAVNGGKLLGYFANPVEIGMDGYGAAVMPTLRSFIIAYNDLSKAQCVALASDRFHANFWLGVKEISIINNNDEQTFGWQTGRHSLPIDKKAASTYCRNGSNLWFRIE